MDPRIPPSGPFVGIARLALAAPLALLTTVTAPVPLVLQYIKGDVGKVLSPLVGGEFTFGIGPGLYLIQAEIEVADAQVTLDMVLGAQNLTTTEVSQNIQATAVTRNQCSLNALLRRSDTPLTASVFAGVKLDVTATGLNTNLTSANLLIYKLANLS